MRVKYGYGYTGATHMTMVFVKRTILFLQCSSSLVLRWLSMKPQNITSDVAWEVDAIGQMVT